MAKSAAPPKAIEFASETQGEAFRYGPYPQVASGDWGSGKTFVYCLKALWLSTTFPKNRGVIARAVGKDLRLTTQQTFFKICTPSMYKRGRRNDSDGVLQLNNQSEILWLHLDNPDLASILRGLEINWFLIDQAEEKPDRMEESFDMLMGRLGRWEATEVPHALIEAEQAAGREWLYYHAASGRPAPPPYAMATANPLPDLKHWIYQRFHPDSKAYRRTYKAQGYRMFEMPSVENRFLSKVNRDILLASGASFTASRWGKTGGTIHDIPAASKIEATPQFMEWLVNACTLHRALVHGEATPTCVLWAAVDAFGNIFVYREYYKPNPLISEHRRAITALSAGESYLFNLAPKALFAARTSKVGGQVVTMPAIADGFADCFEQTPATALFLQPTDADEIIVRNRINEFLTSDPVRRHPITGELGAPRLYFIQATDSYPAGCLEALSETQAQRRKKIGTDLGRPVYSDDRDDKIAAPAYDALRVLMASRLPAMAPAKPAIPAGSFMAARESARAAHRHGGVR